MLCPECTKEIPDNSKFCLECGSDVSGASDESGGETAEHQDEATEQVTSLVGSLDTRVQEASPAEEAVGDEAAQRYELQEEVGRGGFAVVHKALDKRLGRTVAIKRLLPEKLTGKDAERTIARFMREARAIAALSHRNIVQVFDHERDSQGHYIVMEYVGGGTLREYLEERGKLAVDEALQLMRGICQGLSLAHRRNLVHRDIKPGNILLADEDGETVPKIVDFGLARVRADSDTSASGYGMGTPYYMPPEQRRDAKSVNHTADIYALGKTLYQTVTGDVPHNVDPDVIPPPPELARVILKCIKTRPEERFFSVKELLEALEAAATASSPSAVQPVDPVAENLCPSCDSSNPRDAKFCLRCGTGLVRACPECRHDNSVHSRFCGGCGTDVQHFAQAQDALARMEQLAADGKWGRVSKEFSLLPEGLRLPGPAGSELTRRLGELDAQAESSQASKRRLRKEIEDAVGAEQLEQALELVAAFRKIDPADEEVNALARDLPRRLDERDYAAASEAAEQAESRGRCGDAIKSYKTYLEQWPLGAHANECMQRIERALAIEDAMRDVEGLLAQGRFDKARSRFASIEPVVGRDSLPELMAPIDAHEDKYLRRMAEAQQYREEGELVGAEGSCKWALTLCPEAAAPRDLLGKVKTERLWVGRLESDVRSVLRAAQFDEAREMLHKAKELWPRMGVLGGLEEELEKVEEDYLEAIGAAQFYREEGRRREALDAASTAKDLCPDSALAIELAADRSRLGMLVRRVVRWLSRGKQTRRRPGLGLTHPAPASRMGVQWALGELRKITARGLERALRGRSGGELAEGETSADLRRLPEPMQPGLILRSTVRGRPPNQELRIPESPATIGRGADCTVVLDDTTVSERHAQLERRHFAWHLTDLGSRNGVYVNDERIEPNTPRPINHFDHLCFGIVEAQFLPADSETVKVRGSDATRRARRSWWRRKTIFALLIAATLLAVLLAVQGHLTRRRAEALRDAEAVHSRMSTVVLHASLFGRPDLDEVETKLTRLRECIDELVRLAPAAGTDCLRDGQKRASEKVVGFCEQLLEHARTWVTSSGDQEALRDRLLAVEKALDLAGDIVPADKARSLRHDVQTLREKRDSVGRP